MLVAGCALIAPPPSAPAPPASAPRVPEPPRAEDPVLAVLAAAERALAEDRLLTPANDNAHMHFTRALRMVPELPQARRGMERIVDRYIALAHGAVARRKWPSARLMLDRASVVIPDHPGIAPLRRQVDMLANAERHTLELDGRAVKERDPEVAARLANFGRRARLANARVTIRAASDADGRWIHEQMRKAPGSARIRGRIEIGLPPQVTVLILDVGDPS